MGSNAQQTACRPGNLQAGTFVFLLSDFRSVPNREKKWPHYRKNGRPAELI